MIPILTLSGLCFSHFYLHSNETPTDRKHSISLMLWEDEESLHVRMGCIRFTNELSI